MNPIKFLLRCYVERKSGHWQAFCIDLNLAVQGESQEEVVQKLHQQIHDYLRDIFEGEDRPYAAQLLNRKAPLSLRLRYYQLSMMCKLAGLLRAAKSPSIKDRFAFRDAMPVKLA